MYPEPDAVGGDEERHLPGLAIGSIGRRPLVFDTLENVLGRKPGSNDARGLPGEGMVIMTTPSAGYRPSLEQPRFTGLRSVRVHGNVPSRAPKHGLLEAESGP